IQIAVDPFGNLYVLYEINTGTIGVFVYIAKIDPSGKQSGVGSNIRCCTNPIAISTDAKGNFYYIGGTNNSNVSSVFRMAPDGTGGVLPVSLGAFQGSVTGMTVDVQGNIYFSEGNGPFNDQ